MNTPHQTDFLYITNSDEDAPPAVFGERKFNYLLYANDVVLLWLG
jgi:hypothetical protein